MPSITFTFGFPGYHRENIEDPGAKRSKYYDHFQKARVKNGIFLKKTVLPNRKEENKISISIHDKAGLTYLKSSTENEFKELAKGIKKPEHKNLFQDIHKTLQNYLKEISFEPSKLSMPPSVINDNCIKGATFLICEDGPVKLTSVKEGWCKTFEVEYRLPNYYLLYEEKICNNPPVGFMD